MKFMEPTIEYDEQIQAYRRAFSPEMSMDGSGGLREFDRTEDWLKTLERYQNPETVPEGKVQATQYLYVREEDKKVVGVLQIVPDALHVDVGPQPFDIDKRRLDGSVALEVHVYNVDPALGLDIRGDCACRDVGGQRVFVQSFEYKFHSISVSGVQRTLILKISFFAWSALYFLPGL